MVNYHYHWIHTWYCLHFMRFSPNHNLLLQHVVNLSMKNRCVWELSSKLDKPVILVFSLFRYIICLFVTNRRLRCLGGFCSEEHFEFQGLSLCDDFYMMMRNDDYYLMRYFKIPLFFYFLTYAISKSESGEFL